MTGGSAVAQKLLADQFVSAEHERAYSVVLRRWIESVATKRGLLSNKQLVDSGETLSYAQHYASVFRGGQARILHSLLQAPMKQSYM